MTSPCGHCGERPRLSFHSYCRECKRESDRQVNAKRRDKIRQWERDHMTPCLDCGTPCHGWRKSRPSKRCPQCAQEFHHERARERTTRWLELRKQGLSNIEIAAREGVSSGSVADQLQRARVARFPELTWVRGPYKYRNEVAA